VRALRDDLQAQEDQRQANEKQPHEPDVDRRSAGQRVRERRPHRLLVEKTQECPCGNDEQRQQHRVLRVVERIGEEPRRECQRARAEKREPSVTENAAQEQEESRHTTPEREERHAMPHQVDGARIFETQRFLGSRQHEFEEGAELGHGIARFLGRRARLPFAYTERGEDIGEGLVAELAVELLVPGDAVVIRDREPDDEVDRQQPARRPGVSTRSVAHAAPRRRAENERKKVQPRSSA
jgi:hypothetical protein